MSITSKRLNALEKARDNAKDTDFKLLWEKKRIELLKKHVGNVPYEGDFLNGWPTDGEPDYDSIQ